MQKRSTKLLIFEIFYVFILEKGVYSSSRIESKALLISLSSLT